MTDETDQGTTETLSGQLAIQKIYVKDASFEAPGSPQTFLEEWKPNVDIQLNNRANPVGQDVHEVVLTVTVTVKTETKAIYLVEVQQAGIFTIGGFADQHLAAILATVCPNILFPYVREVISDLVVRGGFPPLLLAPVNFDALYAQELQRQQGGGAAPQTH
jgi:preprotein translocase subunit SecB